MTAPKYAEYHVSLKGDDLQDGSAATPFRTIQRAAETAEAGDVITVHAGTYRERVDPPRGGTSRKCCITYRAAPGEHVIIKGSEVVTGWQKIQGGAWKATLPCTFFKDHNPFAEALCGDWFDGVNRTPHTGEVYLNGCSLYEKYTARDVVELFPIVTAADPNGTTAFWHAEVSAIGETTLLAHFGEADPNRELVEVNARSTCFYPSRPGVNYLTVRGFIFCQAATQWAAPTAEQVGMVATHWNKGWIIEDNVLHDSKCNAITLGKERSTGHNVWSTNPAKDGSVHYIEVIFKALGIGWNRETIGSHVVRRNRIFNCEQTGICGSMGCAFSEITDNEITDIWVKQQFRGAEIAAIKFHGAIDALIARNRLAGSFRGLWLDWMTQGTRISGNLFHDNLFEDLYVEVNHGPYVVDNNLFLTRGVSLKDESQGGAYFHNVFGGAFTRTDSTRFTPYHVAHSTAIAGFATLEQQSDNRFYNNLFLGGEVGPIEVRERYATCGLGNYEKVRYPVQASGNVYYNGASGCSSETKRVAVASHNPAWELTVQPDGLFFHFTSEALMLDKPGDPVDGEMLGTTFASGLGFESPDGSVLASDRDYLGEKRTAQQPFAGAFSKVILGENVIKIWDEKSHSTMCNPEKP